MATIIIPAYNEEPVIASTLGALHADGAAAAFEVIVVCNGCTDRTAELARALAPPPRVIELDRASKTAAINAGEKAAGTFPHIVLDADVEISGASVSALIEALRSGALAAEPVPDFDVERSSYPVRAFYRTWLALHGGEPGDIGAGVYGLSQEGRARFGLFPEVIADDAFARAHFAPSEIVVSPDARSRVRAPQTVAGLVRVKTRSELGKLELAREYPALWGQKRSATVPLRSKILALPRRVWVDVPVYLALKTWIRFRARSQFQALDEYEWERDERGG